MTKDEEIFAAEVAAAEVISQRVVAAATAAWEKAKKANSFEECAAVYLNEITSALYWDEQRASKATRA